MFWKYNIWGFLWLLVILIACATPGEKLPPSPFLDFDKLIHLGIFAVLQLLFLRGLLLQQNLPLLKKNYLMFATFFSVDYGVLMEVLQGFVFRNRSFDWFDIIANVAGVVLATIIWTTFLGKKVKARIK